MYNSEKRNLVMYLQLNVILDVFCIFFINDHHKGVFFNIRRCVGVPLKVLNSGLLFVKCNENMGILTNNFVNNFTLSSVDDLRLQLEKCNGVLSN